MISGYEDEKKSLADKTAALEREINATVERKADVDKFLKIVAKYTAIQELDYENVHEFIDRILIHELDLEAGTRKVEIFYSFVGQIDSGDEKTENVSYLRQHSRDVKSIVI